MNKKLEEKIDSLLQGKQSNNQDKHRDDDRQEAQLQFIQSKMDKLKNKMESMMLGVHDKINEKFESSV